MAHDENDQDRTVPHEEVTAEHQHKKRMQTAEQNRADVASGENVVPEPSNDWPSAEGS